MEPLASSPITGDIKFKVWFNNGGAMDLLKAWRFCLEQLRTAASKNLSCDLIALVEADKFKK